MGAKRSRIKRMIRNSKKPVNPKMLASCYGKQRRTQSDAQAAARLMDINAYPCKFCPHWHIGRKQK